MRHVRKSPCESRATPNYKKKTANMNLQIQWEKFSQQVIQKRFRSMRRRLRECTTKRNGHPHYLSHFCHAPLPDWTDLWIWYEHDTWSFLCVSVSQYSKLYQTYVFTFIFLVVFKLKDNDIDLNIPNFCPPVYTSHCYVF